MSNQVNDRVAESRRERYMRKPRLDTPEAGLKAKMDHWKDREAKMDARFDKKDFEILVAQALNLAVSKSTVADSDTTILESARRYASILLSLRTDKTLKNMYNQSKYVELPEEIY